MSKYLKELIEKEIYSLENYIWYSTIAGSGNNNFEKTQKDIQQKIDYFQNLKNKNEIKHKSIQKEIKELKQELEKL